MTKNKIIQLLDKFSKSGRQDKSNLKIHTAGELIKFNADRTQVHEIILFEDEKVTTVITDPAQIQKYMQECKERDENAAD